MPEQSGPQLSLVLENDRKAMHVAIMRDGKVLSGVVLTAEQVDAAIVGIADVRSRMLPAPSTQPAPVQSAAVEQMPPEPTPPEPAPTEFSPGLVREIKGTHYDFGIDENTQQLIFSARDQGLGWLSFRFGVRLLERMLKVARSAQKPSGPGSDTEQQRQTSLNIGRN
jgi:hypothetical protein